MTEGIGPWPYQYYPPIGVNPWTGIPYPNPTASTPPSSTPSQTTVQQTVTATATQPSLQFSFTTIGRVIMRSIGKARLPGDIIWALGINASGDITTSSYCTFAAAYCAPINPYEAVHINRMWANGTLFYDLGAAIDNGIVDSAPPPLQSPLPPEFQQLTLSAGIVPPDNINAPTLTALQVAIDGMFIYPGDEAQLPNPLIVADRGVDKTPAFRGLRYCVFPAFPLQIAHNSMPNINIEWVPDDGARISVASVFQQIGALEGLVVRCENINDMCDGYVMTSDMSFAQICAKERGHYNFQVIDQPDGSILLARRILTPSLFLPA